MEQKILIVDDDPLIVKGLAILLNNAGYATKITQKADEVIPLVTSFKPGLILLDVMLGGPDGREIAQSLKKSKTTKFIPIILISANHYMEQEYEIHGAHAFVSKPFDSMHLLKKIREHCL